MFAPLDSSSVDQKIAKAKKSILASFGASSSDRFLFAASGEEALHKVFLTTYLDCVRETGRTHLLFYPSITSPTQVQMMEKLGCLMKALQGQITRDALEEQLRPRTALVSLPWADPFTGVIHPILDLGELCREKEILLHVDATDVFGKRYFRSQDFPIDFLTFEGGVLAREDRCSSIPSADSILILELATSLEERLKQVDHLMMETARLRCKFEEGLLSLPDVRILFQESDRLPHITAAVFEGVHPEALLFYLQRRGITAQISSEALSFSLCHETTEEEIEKALEVIRSSLKKLQAFSL